MARSDTHNSSRYWTDPGLPGLACLHADFTTHDYAPHSHDAYVVAVTEEGGAEFKSRGAIDRASAARLLVFNPAEPHSGRMGWSPRWRYRGFYLPGTAIRDIGTALGLDSTPYFTANIFADPDLIKAFLSLHQALDERRGDNAGRELFVASFGTLFRRHGCGGERIAPAPADRVLAATVQALVAERHCDDLKLADMAASVDLTEFQLIGLFHRTLGLTPHAYLTQVRLARAIGGLRDGVAPVEAALAAGFCDQSAFNKHFKRSFGVTPLQWLRATRA